MGFKFIGGNMTLIDKFALAVLSIWTVLGILGLANWFIKSAVKDALREYHEEDE